jgi:small subunit ribosomal protein S17
MTNETSNARTVVGTVVSNKMVKTIVVLVERLVKHPKYGKILKKSTKLHAHVNDNMPTIGSTVKIRETKPFSKTKTWELVEVIS